MALIDEFEDQLLACLCRMLEEEGRPVCACHFYAGENRPPADRCGTNDTGGNGQAWLRRDTSQLSTSGGRATFGGGICGEGDGWETTIELGIYRCITAVPDDNGKAPPKEAYDDDRALMNFDKQTLYRVLCCEVWDNQDAIDAFTINQVRLDPIGPQGACGGASLLIRVTGNPMDTSVEEPGFASAPAGGGEAALWQ